MAGSGTSSDLSEEALLVQPVEEGKEIDHLGLTRLLAPKGGGRRRGFRSFAAPCVFFGTNQVA